MKQNPFKSSLFRDAIQLVIGTLGGRLLLLASLPILTRLYEPDDFKLLAVFLALISSISVAACMRFEVAIPLAEDDDDAINLLNLALLSATITSTIILIFSISAPATLALWIGTPDIAPYLWLVAAGVFFGTSFTVLQYWATRMRRFSVIARVRFSQAATGAVAMLGMGWLGIVPIGLLVGNLLALCAGVGTLTAHSFRIDREHFTKINRNRIRNILSKYWRFPVFSTPEALTNILSIQIPILIFAAYSGADAGQLYLAIQAVAVPMTLLGASIGQVYASRAAEELSNGSLNQFTGMMMRRLFFVGLVPMVLVLLLGPKLFPIIFGSEWQRAGVIAAWIAPWMLIQLIASPVALVMALLGYQKEMLILSLSGAVIRIGVVVIASQIAPALMLEAYAVSSTAFFGVCAVIFYRTSMATAKLRRT